MALVVLSVVLSALVAGLLIMGVVAYYADPEDWSGVAIVVCTLGLWSALLCIVCVPVDTYSVGLADSTAAAAAAVVAADPTAEAWEQQGWRVRVLYETLFSVMLLSMFVLVPLAYFYYEQGTWEQAMAMSTLSRCCAALQFTVVLEFFVVLVLVFLLLLQPETDIHSFRDDKVEWVKQWAQGVRHGA
jgi:hypothetical protein